MCITTHGPDLWYPSMENDILKLYFTLKNRWKGCYLNPAQMDLGGAGGSRRNVLREWARSAGWGVGLSDFVWPCSGMLCFWNTRKDKHIHNKNIKAETENSELVCKHSPPESKLKAPWAQPRNSWGDGVIPNCTDVLWRSDPTATTTTSY